MLMAAVLTTPSEQVMIRRLTNRVILYGHGYIAGAIDILLAKLHIIHRGLSLVREMNFQGVICYSDSLRNVDILKEPTPRYHKYVTLFKTTRTPQP